MRRHLQSLLALAALLTSFRSIVACGCEATAVDLRVTPGEACLHVTTDVCQASTQTLQITNDCPVTLTILAPEAVNGFTPSINSTSVQKANSTSSLSIATAAYDDGENHVVVPALLGETPIYITYEIRD